MIPSVLIDLVNDLKASNLIAEDTLNGDGRPASLIDERNIIEWLVKHPKWKNFVIEQEARLAGDILVKDYNPTNPIHLVNIKSTFGTTDNATSMCGFAYALTDLTIEELPYRLSEIELQELINTRGTDNPIKDYYYLTFNKKCMQDVFIRGSKNIINWVHNPTNKLQINWKKEWTSDYPSFNYQEALTNIWGGLALCWDKKVKSMPSDWSLK